MAKSLYSQDLTKLSEATNRPWLVHIFRVEGITHAVTSVFSHVSRKQGHRALCAKPITPEAQRIAANVPISCPVCLRDTTALGQLYNA